MSEVIVSDGVARTVSLPTAAEGKAEAWDRLIAQVALSDAPNAIQKVEQLWELSQKVQAKNAEASFNRDFALMQGEIPVIQKRGEIKVNNEVRSRYALFEDIDRATKPVLARHGFALSFRLEPPNADGKLTVTGILMHREGHREQTSWSVAPDVSGSKNATQAQGSSLSYAKRYICSLLLNIAQGQDEADDDDGQKAGVEMLSEAQAAEIKALLTETNSDVAAFLKAMGGFASVDAMPATTYDKAVRALNRKKEGKHAGK